MSDAAQPEVDGATQARPEPCTLAAPGSLHRLALAAEPCPARQAGQVLPAGPAGGHPPPTARALPASRPGFPGPQFPFLRDAGVWEVRSYKENMEGVGAAWGHWPLCQDQSP